VQMGFAASAVEAGHARSSDPASLARLPVNKISFDQPNDLI
jgi:hypothetical protein